VLGSIGSIALVVAAVAAGVALRGAGAPRWAPGVLGFSALLITAHPPPFGPTGLVIFVVAAALLLRARRSAETPAPWDRRDLVSPPVTSFSGGERLFLLAVPLAWAILLVFHPTGEGENFYPIVRDAWEVVHIGTLLFVPVMAGVVLLLLRGVQTRLAVISRVALITFAVVYMAWEVLIGIGVGVLVGHVNDLGAAQQPVGAILVERLTDSGLVRALELIGTGAWIVALLAAGATLVRERGVSRFALALLALSALPTAWHVAPFGQVGLALFIAAVMLILLGKTSAQAQIPRAQPTSALAPPAAAGPPA